MTIAVILAGLLLCLALLLIFGWPLLVAPRGQRLEVLASPEARFLAGTFASLAIASIMTPFAALALISGGEAVQVFAEQAQGLSFGR